MLPGVFNTSYKKDMSIVRTKLQLLSVIVGLVFFFTLPLYIGAYWVSFLIHLCITIIAGLGLHILIGLCGQISLGQSALMGVGAYTSAILITKVGMSSWLSLPLAGLSAGVVGCVFGAPSLRVKEFYLAMSTLAAQFIIVWAIIHGGDLTGGSNGLYIPSLRLWGLKIGSGAKLCYVALFLTVLAVIVAKDIQRSRVGRAFVAIRDNDLAAESMGINLYRFKLLAFFIGCFFAGVAGWVWAHYMRFVNPEQFGLVESLWLVGILVVGGIGSTAGVVLGAILVRALDMLSDIAATMLGEIFPEIGAQSFSALGLILFGIVVAGFLILEPRGLYHRWEITKAYWRLFPYARK